jgi:hypothetical protein
VREIKSLQDGVVTKQAFPSHAQHLDVLDSLGGLAEQTNLRLDRAARVSLTFAEKLSGAHSLSPTLRKALAALDAGHTILTLRLDRFGSEAARFGELAPSGPAVPATTGSRVDDEGDSFAYAPENATTARESRSDNGPGIFSEKMRAKAS